MNNTRKKFRVGELRPSQVLFTYGIGAVVDLPFISTMVMGLEDWNNPYPEPIGEERLLQAVKSILGSQVSQLLSPPEAPEQEGMPNPFDERATIGVPVAAFPRWMLSCASSRLSAATRLPAFASVSTRCHQNMSMGQWQAFYPTHLPPIVKVH
jgi:hypothetical protein